MTNLAFTALIKSKGYNKQRLADVCGLSKTQMSNRINGANDWRWPEVGKACAALGITLDEFATYYPVADVRKSSAAMPTRAERIDSVLAELREILMASCVGWVRGETAEKAALKGRKSYDYDKKIPRRCSNTERGRKQVHGKTL